MKLPTFTEGVVLALVAATSGSVLFSALNLALPADAVLRLLVPLLSLAYIAYLMSHSSARLGRITAFSAWVLITSAGALFTPSLLLILLLHCAFIWIVRSFYFHNGVLAASADLALTTLSLAALLWATLQTGNLFLTIWCFFLTQALFVAIPKSWPRREQCKKVAEEGFYQAYQTAQKALTKLISSQ